MREASVLAVLVLSSGCNDLPPIKYETEHLVIGTEFDGPVCAGTLHEFDQQVEYVEQTLEFQIQDKLELFLFKDSVGDWCPESVPGCYSPTTKHAYSTLRSARHEIIHAATGQIHVAGDVFFEEGFAGDLTGEGLSFPRTYPSTNLGLRPLNVSHQTAKHFMRWLRSQYTASELKNMLLLSEQNRNPKHAEDAFAKATGDLFADIEQVYLATAAEFFAPFDIITPPTVSPEAGGWDIILDFDCEQIDTNGYDDAMWRRVRIEVTAPGYYVLVATSPAVATLSLRRTEDLQVGDPMPSPPSWPIGDDLFDPAEPWLTGLPTVTLLEVGTYDVEVRVPGVSPTRAAVRIHPQLGEIWEVP